MSNHAVILGLPSRVVQTGNPELDTNGAFFKLSSAGGGRLCVFKSVALNGWIYIDNSRNLTPRIVIDGKTTLSQLAFLYNGKPCWSASRSMKLFYSDAYGEWIYFPSGTGEPFATQKLDGTWDGNSWWGLGSEDPGPNWNPTLTPRGEYIDSETEEPTLEWKWPRWQWNGSRSYHSEAPYGCYVPEDQNDGETRVFSIGIRCWRQTDQGSAVLYASFDGESFEFRVEGQIVRLTKKLSGESWCSNWHHGTDLGDDWFEMSGEPVTGSVATVVEKWYESDHDSVVLRSRTFYLMFYGCVPSGRRRVCRMGEVGQWR